MTAVQAIPGVMVSCQLAYSNIFQWYPGIQTVRNLNTVAIEIQGIAWSEQQWKWEVTTVSGQVCPTGDSLLALSVSLD